MIIRLLIITLFLVCESSAADVTSKALVEGCQEYVAIYDRREQKSLLAGLSTSSEEAMRAGICRGMLEEHNNHMRHRCDRSWYEQATFIAEQDFKNYRSSSEPLLDEACGR